MANSAVRTVYVSNVVSGGIPVGQDDTGTGAPTSPFLSMEMALTTLRSGDILTVNGNPVLPSIYRHKSFLTLRGMSLDCVMPFCAVVQATDDKGRVVSVEPGESCATKIDSVIVDGQNFNLCGIDVTRAPDTPYSLSLNGIKIINCIFHGIWTQNYPSSANIELNDVEISLGTARSCIQHRMADNASLSVTGGTFSVANHIYSPCGFIQAYGAGHGCSITVRNPKVDIVVDPSIVGEGTGAINIFNISGALITGGSYSIDTTAKPQNAQAIVIQPTRDEFIHDCGNFEISELDIKILNIPGGGAGAGIWIGHDGTRDEDVSNGKLNGGVIRGVSVTGTGLGQTAGLLGIAVASHADTRIVDCTVDTASIGFVCKESSPHIQGSLAKNCRSSHYLLKAARPGTIIEGCRSVSTTGSSPIHIYGHDNPATGNNCTGCVVQDNHIINDGAAGAVFVQIDAGQEVKLSGNNYFNRSGTLEEFPWRYHGVYYATLEQWKAAVEPDATSYDPGN